LQYDNKLHSLKYALSYLFNFFFIPSDPDFTYIKGITTPIIKADITRVSRLENLKWFELWTYQNYKTTTICAASMPNANSDSVAFFEVASPQNRFEII
jgi:hypothetical protein